MVVADDESTTTEETPDAVVEVHVDAPEEEAAADTGDTVVVVTGEGGDGDTALDHEHRITALEHSLEELRSEMYQRTTSPEMVEFIAEEAAAEAVADAVIDSAEVAETVAEEVAEETAEEVVEDVSPHRTHWLFRSFGEWTGRNGSGKVDAK